jgi:hypothetical protein
VPRWHARGLTRSSILGVTEGYEVEPGSGEEALEEAGPVLHPPQPGLDQRGELAEGVLDQVGQAVLRREERQAGPLDPEWERAASDMNAPSLFSTV